MILLVLRLVSFSLGSSLLLAFVLALHLIIFFIFFFYLLELASLMKTTLNLRKTCYIATGVVEGAGF